MTGPPAKDAGKVGFLKASFDEGCLFLKDNAGQHYRLEWSKADKKADDRRRALPAGEYTLVGYRIVRRDDQDNEWFISATGRAIHRLVVEEAKEQNVQVEDAIATKCRAIAGADSVQVQMGISGQHHSGLSIYKGGKRILVRYRIASPDGKELAAGDMEYG